MSLTAKNYAALGRLAALESLDVGTNSGCFPSKDAIDNENYLSNLSKRLFRAAEEAKSTQISGATQESSAKQLAKLAFALLNR